MAVSIALASGLILTLLYVFSYVLMWALSLLVTRFGKDRGGESPFQKLPRRNHNQGGQEKTGQDKDNGSPTPPNKGCPAGGCRVHGLVVRCGDLSCRGRGTAPAGRGRNAGLGRHPVGSTAQAIGPVRVQLHRSIASPTARRITIEFLLKPSWVQSSDHYDARVLHDIELPAGKNNAESTFFVPVIGSAVIYRFNVLEDGNVLSLLSQKEWTNYYVAPNEEGPPRMLIVRDKLPNMDELTRAVPGHFEPSYFYAMAPMASNVSPGSFAMSSGTDYVIARTGKDLPRRWTDYISCDLICVSLPQLKKLQKEQPEAFQAMARWVAAGGNMVVHDLGAKWQSLAELESLLAMRPGKLQRKGEVSPRVWLEGDKQLFGKPLDTMGMMSDERHGAVDPSAGTSPKPATSPTPVGPPHRPHRPRGPHGSQPPNFPEEPSPPKPPENVNFRLRQHHLGLVIAISDSEIFPGTDLYWRWLFASIGHSRRVWTWRNGVSLQQANPDFAKFLIPGVGLAPVTAFEVLISLFVIAIGPVNFFILKRWKRVHLMIVTVPLAALVVTGGLFVYAMVADGLQTRVQVRSVTWLDEHRKEATCASHLSYYAGLAPSDGLTFPGDVIVVPYEAMPNDGQTRRREMVLAEEQRLTSGWLDSRTPTQYLTLRARTSDASLERLPSPPGSKSLRLRNRLGVAIEQVVIRNGKGAYYRATNVAPDVEFEAQPAEANEAAGPLRRLCDRYCPKAPKGTEPQDASGRNPGGIGGSYRTFLYYPNATPGYHVSRSESLVSRVMGQGPGAKDLLDPDSYVAIIERSPETTLGLPEPQEEPGLHFLLGTW